MFTHIVAAFLRIVFNVQHAFRRRGQIVVQDAEIRRGDDVARAGDGVGGNRQPDASASSSTMPNVSVRDGKTKISAER